MDESIWQDAVQHLCISSIALFGNAPASHLQAEKLKGGTKRQLQTAIINKAIERVSGTTKGEKAALKVTEDLSFFQDHWMHKKLKYREQSSGGWRFSALLPHVFLLVIRVIRVIRVTRVIRVIRVFACHTCVSF